MFPRLAFETPTVAVFPLAVFGGPVALLPPPPQPATATAASTSTAAPAKKVMDLLRVMTHALRTSSATSLQARHSKKRGVGRCPRGLACALITPTGERTMIEKPEILYTAEATATGGREGHARTSD